MFRSPDFIHGEQLLTLLIGEPLRAVVQDPVVGWAEDVDVLRPDPATASGWILVTEVKHAILSADHAAGSVCSPVGLGQEASRGLAGERDAVGYSPLHSADWRAKVEPAGLVVRAQLWIYAGRIAGFAEGFDRIWILQGFRTVQAAELSIVCRFSTVSVFANSFRRSRPNVTHVVFHALSVRTGRSVTALMRTLRSGVGRLPSKGNGRRSVALPPAVVGSAPAASGAGHIGRVRAVLDQAFLLRFHAVECISTR